MIDDRIENWLLDICDASKDALSFIEGIALADFLQDKLIQNAVTMCLIRIGETATKLASHAPELTTHFPDIPWNSMKGIRNRIAHGYSDINFNVVWDTVNQDLPELRSNVKRILQGSGFKK